MTRERWHAQVGDTLNDAAPADGLQPEHRPDEPGPWNRTTNLSRWAQAQTRTEPAGTAVEVVN
jgi:hypothetical protein